MSILKRPRDWASYFFFNGAKDDAFWRMAVWGCTVGGRVGVVHKVMVNQQVARTVLRLSMLLILLLRCNGIEVALWETTFFC